MKVRLLLCIAIFCVSNLDLFSQDVEQSQNEQRNLVDWVNPYIGNIERLMHPTFPMIHLPNSFLRIYPARDDYTDVTLAGLPLLKAGMGISAFYLNPYQGDRGQIKPKMSYTYDSEELTPYSYSVILDEEETEINLGVSHQSALYQIKFSGEKDSYIVLSSENGGLHWDGTSVSNFKSL